MKNLTLLLFFGLFFSPLSIFAQNAPTHQGCSTSMDDQQVLLKNMIELRQRHPNVATARGFIYVPVWFHIVTKTDGTGGTTEANIAEMLCGWNTIYEDCGSEMQFYIKGFTTINLDALYNEQQSATSVARMRTAKKADALNVYLTNNAGVGANPNEVVLGYYSNRTTTNDAEYSNDWIVCINSQVNKTGAITIAHESAHMMGLVHTFFGWEGGGFIPFGTVTCAPATVTYNGRVMQVEKVARTSPTKNCDVAADGFCDTPADYASPPFNINNCIWTGTARDPDCVPINPDETNMMGTYLSYICTKQFSTEQIAAMRNNLQNHPQRAYLRDNSVTPPLTTTLVTLISPANNATTAYFNNITLDWEDVPTALGYAVDVSRFSSFFGTTKSFFGTRSEVNINTTNAPNIGLTAGVRYYWRVRAIVPFKNCNNLTATGAFTTGTLNTVNEMGGVTHFSVSPNPLSKSPYLSLQMTSATAFDAQIKLFNTIGALIKTEYRRFPIGVSSQEVSISGLTIGTYILSVESEKGVLNKRIIIQ